MEMKPVTRLLNTFIFALALVVLYPISLFAQKPAVAQPSKLAITQRGETITKEAVLKSLNNRLPAGKIKNIEKYVEQSFAGINKNDAVQIRSGIKSFASAAKDNGGGVSPWQSCGDYCDKENNPATYGFCYWKCVIKGGPKALPTTRR